METMAHDDVICYTSVSCTWITSRSRQIWDGVFRHNRGHHLLSTFRQVSRAIDTRVIKIPTTTAQLLITAPSIDRQDVQIMRAHVATGNDSCNDNGHCTRFIHSFHRPPLRPVYTDGSQSIVLRCCFKGWSSGVNQFRLTCDTIVRQLLPYYSLRYEKNNTRCFRDN